MEQKNKNYLSLFLWIGLLILIGSAIGSLTKTEVNTWYSSLNRSSLTPPNYIFGVAWTILYTVIAISGFLIWRTSPSQSLLIIKSLYVIQLIINWSWTALFFRYRLTCVSLLGLIVMDIAVATIIYLAYPKVKYVSLLMMPYLLWILFATYLNFYIWQYN